MDQVSMSEQALVIRSSSDSFSKHTSIGRLTNQVEVKDPSTQITQTFFKLNQTIDHLDTKVNKILEKHEAEFLFAWRNHIKKIKKQLADIKQKADAKEKLLSSNDRLVNMEKQMSIFREEALNLYNEVDERKREAEIYKKKIKEHEDTIEVIIRQNKELIKVSKLNQARATAFARKVQDLESQLSTFKSLDEKDRLFLQSNVKKKKTQDKIVSKTVGVEKFKVNQKKQQPVRGPSPITDQTDAFLPKKTIYSISHHSKQQSMPRIIQFSDLQKIQHRAKSTFRTQQKWKISEKSLVQNNEYQPVPNQKNSFSYSPNSLRKKLSYHMYQPRVYDSELKNWFLECIRVIKKEVSSRKVGFKTPSSQIMKVESIEQFKTIDKLRLLEMFLENEKLLVHMYEKIFPGRMTEIQSYLALGSNNVNSKQAHPGINSSQKKKQGQKDNTEILIALEDEMKHSNIKNNHSYVVQSKSSISKVSKSHSIRKKGYVKDGKLNAG